MKKILASILLVGVAMLSEPQIIRLTEQEVQDRMYMECPSYLHQQDCLEQRLYLMNLSQLHQRDLLELKSIPKQWRGSQENFQTSAEIHLILEKIVEAEATGFGEEHKLVVANVILNRVNSPKFPNTVEQVVFQNRQFSPISDGRYYTVKVTQSTKNAVRRALNGEDNSQDSLYFMNPNASSSKNVKWFRNNLKYVKTIDCHEFYKNKGEK